MAIRLSHSTLTQILDCPMSFYLNKIQGIFLAKPKAALQIGSNVHWGIEHNTCDLSEILGTETAYGRDELLAESMVYGYLKHKDELFNQILSLEDGEKLKLLDEKHEVFLTGKLPSKVSEDEHEFIGIIDLLLLTNKGFIIIDYKTSSQEPDWDKYLDQIYRYIFLLNCEFPDIPVIKVGIINLRKTGIRQKKTENEEQFLNRLKFEYELNDENYINYHEYLPETLDERLIKEYIDNLAKMCDLARSIQDNNMYFINYSKAWGQYGKSDYYDIFYHVPDCYILYNIRDDVLDEDGNLLKERQCKPIDMLVIDHNNILNHYSKYKEEAENYKGNNFHQYLKDKYITDDDLLEMYENNLSKGI